MNSRHLDRQAWANLRLEYETSSARPTLRELADKHAVPRSTIFKRAAREKWKQNAALVEATRKQIAGKMEAEQVMADLQPWIEQEKAKHVRRIVNIAKRGFERIEKVWDENEPCSSKEESLAAATLDKDDAIIRRNLGMSETSAASCSLNLHVLTGSRAIVQIAPDPH